MSKKTAAKAPTTPPLHQWHVNTAEGAALLGKHCRACGCYFFPPWQLFVCGNPHCDAGREQLEEVPLSCSGTLWSWTVNHYPAPPPFPNPEPFVPYATVVVQLKKEQLCVLGGLHPDCDLASLRADIEMELAPAPLAGGDAEQPVWHWRVSGGSAA